VQQPYVPLLIAGGGEVVTLRQVAEHADVSNFGAHPNAGRAFTLTDVRHKFDALRRHCAVVNRPFASVLRSHWSAPVVVAETREQVDQKVAALADWLRSARFESSTVAGTPDEVADVYRSLVTAGMQYFTVCVAGNDVETLRLLAEQVIPAVQPD
jgi:alkanesulfonate monooxygenase SsuD/methylene tetrahydromethanopterin reductase-like flavin-dependent oxidoreductase (luciferase family)